MVRDDVILMRDVIDTLCDMSIPNRYIVNARQVVDHFGILHKKPTNYDQVWLALVLLCVIGSYQDLKKNKTITIEGTTSASDFHISW